MVCTAAFSSPKPALCSVSLSLCSYLFTDFLPICSPLMESPDENFASLFVMKTEKEEQSSAINRRVDLWPADDRKRGPVMRNAFVIFHPGRK